MTYIAQYRNEAFITGVINSHQIYILDECTNVTCIMHIHQHNITLTIASNKLTITTFMTVPVVVAPCARLSYEMNLAVPHRHEDNPVAGSGERGKSDR